MGGLNELRLRSSAWQGEVRPIYGRGACALDILAGKWYYTTEELARSVVAIRLAGMP